MRRKEGLNLGGERNMSKFEIRGRDLYDAHHHRIATARGMAIYNGDNQRVASIRGDELLDADERKMATVRGSDIYDADSKKVGSLSDVQESIRGALAEIMHVRDVVLLRPLKLKLHLAGVCVASMDRDACKCPSANAAAYHCSSNQIRSK